MTLSRGEISHKLRKTSSWFIWQRYGVYDSEPCSKMVRIAAFSSLMPCSFQAMMKFTECSSVFNNSVGNLVVKGATGVDFTSEAGECFNVFGILTINPNRNFWIVGNWYILLDTPVLFWCRIRPVNHIRFLYAYSQAKILAGCRKAINKKLRFLERCCS